MGFHMDIFFMADAGRKRALEELCLWRRDSKTTVGADGEDGASGGGRVAGIAVGELAAMANAFPRH